MFFHWFGDFSTSRTSQVLPVSLNCPNPIPPPMAKIFPFATTEANLKSYKKFTILLITITVNKTKKIHTVVYRISSKVQYTIGLMICHK